MREIEIKTNLDVITYNFVDSLSKWDYFVAKHVYEYYVEQYGLSDEDKLFLSQYAEARAPFGWESDMEIFAWAYGGFRADSKFSLLYLTIKHFRSNTKLSVELSEAANEISTLVTAIRDELIRCGTLELAERFWPIFKVNENDNPVPAYLTYTPVPDSVQGGANGDGIYTQVPLSQDMTRTVGISASVLFHEYLHKALNPSAFFVHNLNPDGFYSQIIESVYPDRIADLFEEVVVYTLSDTITYGNDPELNIEHCKNGYDNRKEMLHIWTLVKEVKPLFESFLQGEIGGEKLVRTLDQAFRKYDFKIK